MAVKTVSEALAAGLSVRDFLPDPVPEAALRRPLEKAARVAVLTGAPLADFVSFDGFEA